jgi:DNA recombination protein RmuC
VELLLAFLAGAGSALVVGLLWRQRSLAAQAEAHAAELATQAEAAAQELAVRDAEHQQLREAAVRLEAEVAKVQALAAQAEAEAARREEWLAKQKEEMEKAFQALSASALEQSNKSFLERATERMKPLGEQLTRLERATAEMENKREKAYGGLSEQIGKLSEATEHYRSQAESLSTALRGSSQARGRIGEMVLRNVVEFAGMTQHCDFDLQSTDASGQRPDLLVKLPDGGAIPVDAKFPLAAYARATEADDPALRAAEMKQHATDLRGHVLEMAKRDYGRWSAGALDFTVLFLPGDHLLADAFEILPDLQEEAMKKRILIATPVTLVALLRTVSLYWQQRKLADNAQEIADQAAELMARLGTFLDHFAKVGRGLGQAVGAFNQAVGSYEKRILPTGRRVVELQGKASELPEVPRLEQELRGFDRPGLREGSETEEDGPA